MEIYSDEARMKQTENPQLSSSPPAAMAQTTNRRPSLLPAFEPFSSSPVSRPAKRKHGQSFLNAVKEGNVKHYPTPVPTSSTGILPSSPPQRQHLNNQHQQQLLQQSHPQPRARPGLQRTISTLSERAPLSAVPSLTVSADGEPLLLGRSSSSSDYQLSANRLISRVHVKAVYSPPSDGHPRGCVQIECVGWNGAKVHCHGQAQDLAKGETLTFEDPSAEIMIDVQETRVILAWPSVAGHARKGSRSLGSTHAWLAEVAASPSRRILGAHHDVFASSPPLMGRPHSPESPTPANRHSNILSSALSPSRSESAEHALVQIYEDSASDDDKRQTQKDTQMQNQDEMSEARFLNESQASDRQNRAASGLNAAGAAAAAATSSPVPAAGAAGVASSGLTAPGLFTSGNSDDFSDRDEENDPIIHSFGPYGANILPRLESFNTNSPVQQQPMIRRRHHALKQKAVASSPTPQQRLMSDVLGRSDGDGIGSSGKAGGPFADLATSFSSPVKCTNATETINTASDAQHSTAATTAGSNSPVRNHVINQLAFSRLHAMPLSTLWGNLPRDLKMLPVKSSLPRAMAPTGLGIKQENGEGVDCSDGRSANSTPAPLVPLKTEHELQPDEKETSTSAFSTFTPPVLQQLLEAIPCVGLIERKGKDAAGKPLEAQFYYVPEMDENIVRREAVLGGRGGTGLRAVRKNHKVCFHVLLEVYLRNYFDPLFICPITLRDLPFTIVSLYLFCDID